MRDDIEELIAKTAAALHRKYRRFAEAEDIRQEMWVWAIPREKDLDGLSAWNVRRRLYDAGDRHCRKEKAAQSGFDPDDEVFYSAHVIRMMLPYATTTEPIANKSVDDKKQTGKRTGPQLYTEWETTVADLRAAFGKVSERHRSALLGYVDGDDMPRRDVERAIRAMQRALGGRRPIRWK